MFRASFHVDQRGIDVRPIYRDRPAHRFPAGAVGTKCKFLAEMRDAWPQVMQGRLFRFVGTRNNLIHSAAHARWYSMTAVHASVNAIKRSGLRTRLLTSS
jgi:hypothetical protein